MSKKMSELPVHNDLLTPDDTILLTSNGVTKAVKAETVALSFLPAGIILPFGGGDIPTGWLPCDGRTVSRSAYPKLFAALGTIHGHGDAVSTFHIPDFRGRFMRGADDMGTGAAGRDLDGATRTAANAGGATGNGVGSFQGEQTKSHTHAQNAHNHTQDPHGHTISSSGPVSISGGGTGEIARDVYVNNTMNVNASTATNNAFTATNQNTGGNETRPQNLNVKYIIKA